MSPWIASRSLSSGARSRDPVARNDGQNKHHAPTTPNGRSFELAAERGKDLTPLIYRRLFNERSEAQVMFRSEGSDPVKGSMLR